MAIWPRQRHALLFLTVCDRVGATDTIRPHHCIVVPWVICLSQSGIWQIPCAVGLIGLSICGLPPRLT